MTGKSEALGALRLGISTDFAYSHALGGLSPFFRALAEGRLLASRCSSCGATFCAPRLLCPCGAAIETWIDTGGGAVLRRFTDTLQGSRQPGGEGSARYGLVAVDGCQNLLFAHLAEGDYDLSPGRRLRLRSPGAEPLFHPIQYALFEPNDG